MHDILRERLMRKIESLPEEQVYQMLDYIEFLEAKYGSDADEETSGLRRFAEAMEDKLRKRSVSPAKVREAFQLLSAADRVLSNVSSAGRKLMEELTPVPDKDAGKREQLAADEDSGKRDHAAADEGSGKEDHSAADEDSEKRDHPAADEDSGKRDDSEVDELSEKPEPSAVDEGSEEHEHSVVDEISEKHAHPAVDEVSVEGEFPEVEG
jgi:hypothetical protein